MNDEKLYKSSENIIKSFTIRDFKQTKAHILYGPNEVYINEVNSDLFYDQNTNICMDEF